jgi:hypothetical protein
MRMLLAQPLVAQSLVMLSLALLSQAAVPSFGAEVLATPPSDVIVTVYRAPYREAGSMDLADLGGFALVTETRTVNLPAGESRLRFEGVADGIEPASAIVTGFPAGVIEKNRDAKLLSPSALISSAVGKQVELLRGNAKTGTTERLLGALLSDAQGGVAFQTAQGIEGLRCSGLPETFNFEIASGLSARPTLSVLVRTAIATVKQVTLSYLARGFDWSADYTATLSADGKTLDLGAWVTLANANGVGFPSAQTQVVAGKLNRETGAVDPIDLGGPILAQCWPRGSTSDAPEIVRIARAVPFGFEATELFRSRSLGGALAAAPAALKEDAITVTAQKRVQQEQLGDLKLYRVPDRTTVASRQSKQVRLMDRTGVPVNILYGADFSVEDAATTFTAYRLLRTKNDTASHLGLPLPSGTVAVFGVRDGERLLERESTLRDLAVGEEVEINLGQSPDVEVARVTLKSAKTNDEQRVEISNARDRDIQFELRLRLPAGDRIAHADRPMGAKDGRPIFLLKIPANGKATLTYQTQRTG